MKNHSSTVIFFLQIILWVSLVSIFIAMIAIGIGAIDSLFNLNFNFLKTATVNIGDEKVSFVDLKAKGKINFLLFALTSLYYLGLLAALINNGLKLLKKVDFQNPFTLQTSGVISKMGSIALQLGILNIVFSGILQLIYNGSFTIDFNFTEFNFIVVAATLYLISLIFRRGVELQSENELTI